MIHMVKVGGIIFNIANVFLMPNERGNGFKLLVGNKEIPIDKYHADLIESYIKEATKQPNVDVCFNDLTPNYVYGFSHKEKQKDNIPLPPTYEQRMKEAKDELVTVQSMMPFIAKERSPSPSALVEKLKQQNIEIHQEQNELKQKRIENNQKNISETEINKETFKVESYSDLKLQNVINNPSTKVERL